MERRLPLTQQQQQAHKLWRMPPEEFNAWRRQNDLPRLLAYFKKALPHFEEWLNSFKISDAAFLDLNRPSRFFLGDSAHYLLRGYDHDGKGVYFVSHLPGEAYEKASFKAWKHKLVTTTETKMFLPYFHWLRKSKDMPLFRVPDDNNNGYDKDFSYRSKTRPGLPSLSAAHLFYRFTVLKLGGVAIRASCFDERNLDFVDLDGLKISGRGGDRGTHVAYSSCSNLVFNRADKPFVTFEKCVIEDLKVERSNMQDLHFYDCKLVSPAFVESRLVHMVFLRTSQGEMVVQNCNLTDLVVKGRPSGAPLGSMSSIYKVLRTAFQQHGNRKAASEFFYRERVEDMLGSCFPVISNSYRFAHRTYRGSYRDLYERWKVGQFTTAKIWKFLLGNLGFYAKLLFIPYHWPRLFKDLSHASIEVTDWALWGFGERPGRVFGWIAALIGAFFLFLYFGTTAQIQGNGYASLFSSLSIFGGMGCPEIEKFGDARYIAGVFSLVGTALFGLLVAGFANRTRY